MRAKPLGRGRLARHLGEGFSPSKRVTELWTRPARGDPLEKSRGNVGEGARRHLGYLTAVSPLTAGGTIPAPLAHLAPQLIGCAGEPNVDGPSAWPNLGSSDE